MTASPVPAVERAAPPAVVTRVGNPVLTSPSWRVNLRGGPTPVELTLLGRRCPAKAVLHEDPVVVAAFYRQLIDQLGLARAGQRLGIRINVDRVPSDDELVDAARREHLSVVQLHLDQSR